MYLSVEELFSKVKKKKQIQKRQNTFLYLTMFFDYVSFL